MRLRVASKYASSLAALTRTRATSLPVSVLRTTTSGGVRVINEEPVIPLIEYYGKVRLGPVEIPPGKRAGLPVDHIDYTVVSWNVGENSRPVLFQLEGLSVTASALEIPHMGLC